MSAAKPAPLWADQVTRGIADEANRLPIIRWMIFAWALLS
jgi:hypothetical protein